MIPSELSSECKVPVTGSAGREAFFDINSSTPGDFIHPVLFDDETWSFNTNVEMIWVFFKGDPMSGSTPGHPFDMPFTPSTLFSIDLLDSFNSTLQIVMPPTNSTPFWDAGAPFGHPDGKHMLAIPGFKNRSCPTNTFGLMIYRWTVPTELATNSKVRLRLSTNDSDVLHFSGEVTVRANHALSHAIKPYPILPLGCHGTTFLFGSLLVLGILLILRWTCGSTFSCRRRVRSKPINVDEKNLLP